MNMETYDRLRDVLEPIRALAQDPTAAAGLRGAAAHVVRAIDNQREPTLRELAQVGLDPQQTEARRIRALERLADQLP